MDDPLGLRTPQPRKRKAATKGPQDPGFSNVAEEALDPQDLAIERMWPLDLSLAMLGGLVIYTIATRLPQNDPRWYYNPWLFAAIVPLGVVGTSLLLRNIASRFVRKSLQFGFLLSVMVHVLMMIAAFNVMIFNQIWSNSTATGVKPIRAPIRKTVPDYLFTRNDMPQKQPDWSRPVDASTTSRTVTPVETKLPPMELSAQRLEMPSEQPKLEAVERAFMSTKNLPETAPPTPANSAGKLARQSLLTSPSIDSAIPIPEVTQPATASAEAIERTAQDSSSQAPRSSPDSRLPQFTPMPTPQFAVEATAPAVQLRRSTDVGMPIMGSVSVDSDVRSRVRPETNAAPAGAVPATPTIAVARNREAADRVFSDRLTPLSEPKRDIGAELRPTFTDEIGSIVPDRSTLLDAPRARRELASAGLPSINAGNPNMSLERQGRAQRALELPDGLLAGPDVTSLSSNASRPTEGSGNGNSSASGIDRSERAGTGTGSDGNRSAQARGADASLLNSPTAATVNLSIDPGPAGLSADPSRRIGFALAEAVPEIASIDMGERPRRAVEIGGPPPPAGSQVTGARPFDRRRLRTAGGAALTPDGALGLETEEAIERGLAYLAERQNANGSWSLQGHGEATQMRSDTAATGLCLLAFQGAGYTHLEHQYKDTVAKGLKFLVDNQKTNGDLYRTEDTVSDRNAWLYSHGIAALAVCEAWGMTRDPSLRLPAQRSIDFIAASQDRRLGGWRYQPGVGSDTSVTGWMMMAMKSAEISGLNVPKKTYDGIERWMNFSQESSSGGSRYRYNPEAPDTETQRHGRFVTPTMTAVGLLARLYMGWERTKPEMRQGAEYLASFPPAIGSPRNPSRDTYYWYYATQVMFHMGGKDWQEWNGRLRPILTSSQIQVGPNAGSWDPLYPVPDRWAPFAGRIYVTSMNLLSLEVYYRHLPIYEETAK